MQSVGMETTTANIQDAVNAARADMTKANWTGLNAAQLYEAGRLVDASLKKWAIDSANEHIDAKFSVSMMNRAETDRAIEYFDAYVGAFVDAVKQSAAATI